MVIWMDGRMVGTPGDGKREGRKEEGEGGLVSEVIYIGVEGRGRGRRGG